jgi:hypothetical protein
MMKAMIHIVPLQRENGLRKRAKATEMTASSSTKGRRPGSNWPGTACRSISRIRIIEGAWDRRFEQKKARTFDFAGRENYISSQ